MKLSKIIKLLQMYLS